MIRETSLVVWTRATSQRQHLICGDDENPSNAVAWFRMGRDYIKLNQSDRALSSLKEAVRVNPEYVDALLTLGLLETEKGYFSDALAHFKLVAHLKPESKEAQMNIGAIYNRLSEHELALKAFQTASELDQKFVLAWYHQGVSYYFLKDYLSAKKVFEKVVELNPDFTDAYAYLGMIHQEEGALDEAIVFWKKRIDTAVPNDPALMVVEQHYYQLIQKLTLV